ncbi:MAG: STAS domain-containing protein [Paludibacteraceae bacterium]|nr:STAS domain-containing protein [Paludibacteraceae bacterium]MBQ2608495.1 STAS domain-containing protein [Paludibacteraceae bacterium]
MKINMVNEGEQLVAQLSGRLDTAAAAEIAPDFQKLAEQAAKHIILDCAQLEYISSSGLRLFLALRKESAAKSGKLQVRAINADIRQVFMMTGFISLFDII